MTFRWTFRCSSPAASPSGSLGPTVLTPLFSPSPSVHFLHISSTPFIPDIDQHGRQDHHRESLDATSRREGECFGGPFCQDRGPRRRKGRQNAPVSRHCADDDGERDTGRGRRTPPSQHPCQASVPEMLTPGFFEARLAKAFEADAAALLAAMLGEYARRLGEHYSAVGLHGQAPREKKREKKMK